MKKRMLAGVLAAMLILGGCSSNPAAETSCVPASEPVSESVPESEPVSEPEPSSSEPAESSAESEYVYQSGAPDFARPDSMVYSTGEEADFPDIRWDFADKYYDIPDAIRAISGAEGESWTPSDGETDSLYDFLHHFGLLIDAVQSEAHLPAVPEDDGELSKFDCEVLCWGDPVQVNRRFASDYAAVTKGGNIATIFWLAAHTPEEYAAIGLTVADVEWAVVECEKLAMPEIADTVAQARENYESYKAEAGPMVYDTRESFAHSIEGGPDWDYQFRYNNIDGELIGLVGEEAFQAWVGEGFNPTINKQTFVEYFSIEPYQLVDVLGIGEREYRPGLDLSEYETEILCYGNQSAINHLFASEYAAVSESGSIYTIFWLARHTAEDYRQERLPKSTLVEVVENCRSDFESLEAYLDRIQAEIDRMTWPQVYGGEDAWIYGMDGGVQLVYNWTYSGIDGSLMDYVGDGLFSDWINNDKEPHNLQTFIEYFDLTADEVKEVLGVNQPDYDDQDINPSSEEIDILCSGDQAAINRTFASEYAAVSDSGSIYTILWLAEHTAADYEAEGIPKSEIESVIAVLEASGGNLQYYLAPLREQAALMAE